MSDATLLGRLHVFERGDKVYLTTPLQLANPTAAAIEEFAFASAVRSQAPNEHIGWLAGRYVEAARPNLNGAMWLSDELALKSLTPMLMPVTVMHDPRTAVGTIADCKLVSEGSSRIDTILAIWKHRFGEVWEEAEVNINDGTMMQSMECLSPSYACSECGQQYVKLREGKEQASWCDHLRSNSSCRILGDVCFTGTGLIFGTRGGRGAYTEASLDHFHDEIAEYHEKAHVDGTYRSSERRPPQMSRVEIEQSELDALRKERNDAKDEAASKDREVAALTTKVEQTEASLATETKRADDEKAAREKSEEGAKALTLRDKRLGELGQDFVDLMGEFTWGRLSEAAAVQSDEDWEATLKEKEELLKTERAAGEKGTGTDGPTVGGPKKPKKKDSQNPGQGGGGATYGAEGARAFENEELAAFVANGGEEEVASANSGSAIAPGRALARSFSKHRRPTPAPTGAK